MLPAPHTLFIHHDKSEVKNLHETEVTSTQIMARGLLKTFVAAASYAKQLHGVRSTKCSLVRNDYGIMNFFLRLGYFFKFIE